METTRNKVYMTKPRKMAIVSAHFYAKHLKIAKNNFTVHFEFVHGKAEKEQTLADCMLYAKNHIVIEIDAGLSLDRMLSTVAHEMVHAKQWLTGKLAIVDGFMQWRGNFVSEDIPYHLEPWELEAMKKEVAMKHLFCYNCLE